MRLQTLLILFSVANLVHAQPQQAKLDALTCPEHKIRFHPDTRLPYKLVLVQQKSYSVAVSYDLDGSGKAQNVRLTSASQNTKFDNAYIAAVRRASITKGLKGTACSLESSFELNKTTTTSVGGA
jgi:TonB family protein